MCKSISLIAKLSIVVFELLRKQLEDNRKEFPGITLI